MNDSLSFRCLFHPEAPPLSQSLPQSPPSAQQRQPHSIQSVNGQLFLTSGCLTLALKFKEQKGSIDKNTVKMFYPARPWADSLFHCFVFWWKKEYTNKNIWNNQPVWWRTKGQGVLCSRTERLTSLSFHRPGMQKDSSKSLPHRRRMRSSKNRNSDQPRDYTISTLNNKWEKKTHWGHNVKTLWICAQYRHRATISHWLKSLFDNQMEPRCQMSKVAKIRWHNRKDWATGVT